jgi:hypothetical protein
VRENVVECDSDPDVAVTVTVEVTGVDPEPPPLPPPPPPQPLNRLRPTTLTVSRRSICKRHRFFQPKQHSATASAAAGNSWRWLRARAGVVEEVATVSVVEAAAPDGVTVAGEKLHDAPAGKPEQANVTLELNPPSSCTVMVVVPLCPAWTETDAGLIATVKSGGMVYVALATALVR